MDRFYKANAVLSLFSKNYMELKRGLPIRPSEMGVLNILSQTSGPHTPVMLAQLLGVSKPMITAHLTSLSEQGYIKKEPSQTDGRVVFITPTEKGQALVARAKQDMDRQLRRLMEAMGETEFEKLVSLAETANEILKKENGYGSQ